MAIQTSCPHCGKSFNIKKDEFVGRKVRCPGCTQPFVIQPLAGAGVGRYAESSQGMQIPESSSPYALDDLADAAESEQRAESMPQASPSLPPLRPLKAVVKISAKNNTGSGRNLSRGFAKQGWMFKVIVIYLILFAILCAISFAKPSLRMAVWYAVLIPAIILYVWGGFGSMITPFRESVFCGIANLLIPFYYLYYVATRWSAMRWHFLRSLVGGLLLCTLFIISIAIEVSKQIQKNMDQARNNTSHTSIAIPFPGQTNQNSVKREPAPSGPLDSPQPMPNKVNQSVRPQFSMSDRQTVPDIKSTHEHELKLKTIAAGWHSEGGEDLFSSLRALRGESRQLQDGVLVLPPWRKFVSDERFQPPVTFQAVIMTNNKDMRFSHAVRQIIFNWEMGQDEFRVDSTSFFGKHKPGAGKLPDNEWVGIEWVVLPDEMIIYVDGTERYRLQADFSRVNEPFTIWCQNGTSVLKELRVVRKK